MPKLTTKDEIAHLLRRAGFGASAEEAARYERLGYEGAVDALLAGLKTIPVDPPGFKPFLPGAINTAWLERMRGTESPLAEKLALFWHGHFATSIRKVEDPVMMWRQMTTFRTLGGGRFRDLVLAVSRDPAMIRWLDGNSNRKGAPNENYARELMELFTLGRGNYTETDVREAARAFTGWGAEGGEFVFRPEHHDTDSKKILGVSGNHDGSNVVEIVTSRPACAEFISRKLMAYFATPEPADAEVSPIAAVFGKSGGDLRLVLRHIFLSPAFRSEKSVRALVKSPAEFVVGAVKAAGLKSVPDWAVDSMGRMGQALFAPPTVKGWDGGRAWLSAGALLERIRFATRLSAEPGVAPSALAVAFGGEPPSAVAPVLRSFQGADRLALALASPEFQLG